MTEVLTLFQEGRHTLGTMESSNFIHVSIKFVCAECGEAWGERRTCVDGEWINYVAEIRPCRLHGNSRLISPFDPIDKLPEAVMAREICYAIQKWLCPE